ncbi:SprB repeat-containing protein, partial [Pedobacter sp. SYSU D00535]|uniref:beta strand repeat-containing protein n=1 Tax=Pedobacter sp. SYSU D00535 TaxID=2810308 RepID=UPI001A956BF5
MTKNAFLKKAWEVLASTKLKNLGLATCSLMLLMNLAWAQTPGLIYKPSSTAAGRSVLDPNGDGYVSATNAGFGATDYGVVSEHQMINVPLMISEPSADLSTGASNGHTEIVSLNGGNSVFVLKKTISGTDYFIVRFRISKASTARKGYSLLIDTDNQFGNITNSNPGFEKEIVLETGFGVKIYTHNVSAGTSTSLTYDLEEHHQRSIAASTNGGDADYFYDFYVPYAALGISGNVRFAATTITSAQSGISGTASDINGINDQTYGGNPFAIYNAVINSFPPTDLSTLTTGGSFGPLVTTAPTITSSLTTSSTSVAGTSVEADGTIITVYKNGLSIGTTTVSGHAWTLGGVSGLTAGNLITAKATAASRTQSAVSNSVEVTAPQTCYTPIPVMGAKVNGSQSMPGTWTMPDGSAIAANTVQIKLYRQTPGSNTFTEISSTTPVYVSATTSGAGSFSFPTGLSQSDFNGARLFATATYNGCASGYSAASEANSGSSLTPAPTITTASVLASTGANTITVQSNYTASTLILYKNGIEIGRSVSTFNNAATTTFSVSGLLEGDKLTARAQGNGTTDVLSNESNVLIVSGTSAASTAPIISNTYIAGSGKTVTGTSTEIPGTTIYLYKTVSGTTTLIGTATLNAFGNWAVSGLTLASGDVLTARADAVGKSLSPASAPVTVQASAPAAPVVTSPILAGASSVVGTAGNTLVKLYVDGSPISTTSNLSSWTIATGTGEIYKGAKVKATNTVSTIESAFSNEVTVAGVDNFLIEAGAGGNIGTQVAGTPFAIKISARDNANATYTNYTGKNTVASASNMSSGAGPTAAFSAGVLSGHSVTLTKAGTYTLTTVSTTDPTITGTSNSFVINPGAASSMTVFQQPSATATSGTPFAQQPVIYLYDAYGNHVNTDNSTQVTVSLGSGTGTIGGTLTRTAVNGVVSFNNLAITGGGAYTLSFASSGLSSVASGTVTLGAATSPSGLSYTSPNVYTVGAAITALDPTVTGSVTSYSISPALPAGLTFNTTSGQISGTPTAASVQTTYTVTASNGSGSTTAEIVITVNAELSATVTSKTDVAVKGASTGAIDITVSGGTAPYIYSWSNGATTEDLTGLAAGTYTVTVTDDNGITATTSATITEPSALLAVSVTSQTDVAVKGASTGAIDITVSGGTAPYTYSWSNGATTEDLAGLAAGTYTVTVTDKNNITATTSATITEPSALLAVSVTSKTDVFVRGASTGAIDITVSGGTAPYTYAWSKGATTEDLTGLAAGTYTVTVSDKNGITATTSATITEPSALLAANVTSQTDVTVKGASTGAIDITVTGGTSPYTYAWSNGATTEDLTGLAAGTYTVTVSDKNGITATTSATITEPSALLAVSVTSKTDVFVKGASTGAIDITVTGGTSPYTYAWSNEATIEDLTGLAAGTYTVTVTDKNNITATTSATITEPSALLAVSVTSQTDVSVKGASTGAIDITVTGGTAPYTYAWSNGATTEDLTGLAAGTYTVTVSDKNGITATTSATITEPSALLAVSVTSQTDVFVKGASTGAIDITVTGGTVPYTYAWSNGATTEDPTGLAAGTYTLTVSDKNGITATTSATIAEPSGLLAVSVTSQTDVFVKGASTGAIDITVTGGTAPYTYAWSNGATTEDLTGLAAGTYTVTVTDKNNITATTSATITEPSALLAVSVTSKTDVFVKGASTGAIDITVTGGTSPYTYAWSNGATTEDLTGLAAGTYTVTVTDKNNITATTSATITEPSALLAVSVTSQTDVFVKGASTGAIDITVTGGTSPYTYAWSNGATTEDLTGLAAGTYMVTVTDKNNITATTSATITEPSALLAVSVTSQTDVSVKGASTGAIDITVAGGTAPYTYAWSNGATTEDLTGLAAGTYTVTVSDKNGITATTSATITEPSALLAANVTSQTDVTVKGASTGAIDITVTGGTSPYTYAWSNGATTEDLTGLAAGMYTVTVSDKNGITATTSATITEPS